MARLPTWRVRGAAGCERRPSWAGCFAVLAGAFAFVLPGVARAATYYVAPTGSDTATGTMAAPFASWARAQTAAAAGDTVYFRGGTYKYTDATSTCTSGTATVNAVVLEQERHLGQPDPVLRVSGREAGVRLLGDQRHEQVLVPSGRRLRRGRLAVPQGPRARRDAAAQQPQPRVVVRLRDGRQQQHLRDARRAPQHGPRASSSRRAATTRSSTATRTRTKTR